MSQPSSHLELPQFDDAERSVLGAILLDNAYLDQVGDSLRPEDFYRPPHQRLYRSMLEMSAEGLPIDPLTLAERHVGDAVIDGAGGAAFISRLLDGIPRLVNARHYADIVRNASIRRQVVRTANDLSVDAALGEMDVDQMLGQAQRRLSDLGLRRQQKGPLPMRAILEQSLDDLEARQGMETSVTGVPTGFVKLDELTSGWQKGELIILAARPSVGKTALALSMAQHAAIRHGKRVAVFSLEMAGSQLAMRMLCSEARVDAQKARRGQLTDLHWSKLMRAFTRLAEAPIWIDETPAITLTEMRAKCRRLAGEGGVDLIVIDYLQLMGSSERTENRQQEISTISRGLKGLALDLQVPVMALSQLSRAPEQRQGDHRPMLSDLRESGSLEQDADVVAFIYREEIYRKREGKDAGDKKGVAEIIVGKQRNGPTDTVKLAFIQQWTRFENYQAEGPAGAPVGIDDEADADHVTPF